MNTFDVRDRKIKYSICVSNYNMASTLTEAIGSVASQLDDRFEIIVVDDGSTDASIEKLEQLAAKFPIISIIELERDKHRLLGATRNVSINNANGEYIILHIDADDVWENHIKDFLFVFHKLEECFEHPVYIQGQQIGIGKKDLLLSYGPYRNTFMEDRDMWHRLAADSCYFLLEHKPFRKRMTLPIKKRISKAIWIKVLNHMIYDLRRTPYPFGYIFRCLTEPIWNRKKVRSLMHKICRMILVLPAYVISKRMSRLVMPKKMPEHGQFVEYRERTRGTYGEIRSRHGLSPSLDFLSKEAAHIFSTKFGN